MTDENASAQIPERVPEFLPEAGLPEAPTEVAQAPGTSPDARVPWAAVGLFVVLSCVLAWLLALPLWLGDGLASPLVMLVLPATMFTPAVATAIVMLVMKVPGAQRLRWLGMWPLRPAKRVVWFMVLATTVPLVIVLATVFIAGALGLVKLDFAFSGLEEQLVATTPAELLPMMPPLGLLVIVQLVSVPFAALFNSLLAFGEELGWRGWLLPALRPLGVWPALLGTGIVWGLWHSPVILLGYNFGRPDLTGVLFMVGGCIAWGVLLGWSRLRSGSVWPAVIGHGGLNAAGGAVLLFAAAGEEIDFALAGPLGVVAWALIAVIVVVLTLAGQFRREPALAA